LLFRPYPGTSCFATRLFQAAVGAELVTKESMTPVCHHGAGALDVAIFRWAKFCIGKKRALA
jgi:hypothetical protein